jgi:hypothetical protein
MESSFNDKDWWWGVGGFGSQETPGAIVGGTPWTTNDIWLRMSFNAKEFMPSDLGNLVLRLHHDEAVTVYINGVVAVALEGYTTDYVDTKINPEALSAISFTEKNVIAVHCHQTEGGQYIDVGLLVRDSNKNPFFDQ